MSNSSIWPIDRTLLGATTPGQSGPGSNGNERQLHISQSSSITKASLSDCLESYLGHLLGETYPSAEMQLVYSAALANWSVQHPGNVKQIRLDYHCYITRKLQWLICHKTKPNQSHPYSNRFSTVWSWKLNYEVSPPSIR